MGALLLALTCSGEALAATCTSIATGNWGTASTWSCGAIPASTDTVILASPYTVTLNASYTAASLTINSGATLSDTGGRTLTITGNIINNGTFTSTSSGRIASTGAAAQISGSGTFSGSARLYTSGAAPSILAGSTLTFAGTATLRAGVNAAGTTVTTSVLTINGTLTSTQVAGTNFIRLYANSTIIGSTGVISAANSTITYNTSAAKLTNNGSVVIQKVTQNAGSNSWTQGNNSSLTVSAVSTVGTLNASSSGNTVTYNGTSTVIAPTAAGYWNLAGTIFPAACPVAYTISGSSPCPAGGPVSVIANPGNCVDATGIGTVAWAPTPTTNVNLNDTLYATATVNGTTHYLKCTGYNFAIPATATILGVTVNVVRKSSSNSRTTDGAMRLVKAGVIGTVDRSTTTVYTTTDVSQAHGGSADLWGVAWTPADINLATFGAAFAAKTTRNRTVSVNHMPITVTYMPSVALDHILIGHDGNGQTCRSEVLTVTACANAACTAPYFNSATVTGNVTWAGAPGGTLPFTIASGGTGQTTVLLPVSTAQTVTLGTSSVAPTPTNGSTCVNSGGGAACSVVFTAASACFDAVEVGAAVSTPIFTKLSGTAFSLDVLAGSTYTGTLQVELVNSSSGSCATYASLNTQSTTFTSQIRKTLSFTYANAAKDVKVRITGLAASSCSSDRFAIRPSSLTVTSSANADATGASTSATPKVKAGTVFTLNAATAIVGYDGTPVIDNTLILAHASAVTNGTVTGIFGAANSGTGLATGSSFTYNEVGYFKMNVDGVYDNTFTAVDSAAGDCTNDFSNVKVGGKYGCKFGNTAVSNFFGRFIPDHFGVTQDTFDNRADWCDQGVLVSDGMTACVSPAFTYMGEPMNANFTLTAQNFGNTTTQNYTGTFAKLNPIATNGTLAFAAVDGAAPTNLTARLDTSLITTNGSGSFSVSGSEGQALISVPIGIARCTAITCPANLNPNLEDGPYAALDVGIAPVDSDGVTTVFDLDTNNDAVDDHTQVDSGSTEVRYGRIKISNAFGSELLSMPIALTAQYWNLTDYVTNVDDIETALVSTDIVLGNYQRKAGDAWTTTVALPNGTASAGIWAATLTKPAGTFNGRGSVDLTLNAPAYPYLPGITGRATFGVYKGDTNFIYMRENY